ncbi:MAG: YybH family protein [Vampirovibrionales bacterium]
MPQLFYSFQVRLMNPKAYAHGLGMLVLTVCLLVAGGSKGFAGDESRETPASPVSTVTVKGSNTTRVKTCRFGWWCKSHTAQSTLNPSEVSTEQPEASLVIKDTAEEAQVRQVMQALHEAANQHHLEGILKCYAPDYVSGDGYNVSQLKSLLEETWQAYPTMKYRTTVTSIRVSGTSATVESEEYSDATLTDLQALQLDIPTEGKLRSHSKTVTYLKKVSNTWEITTDAILQESSELSVGHTDLLKLELQVPEQVFQGEQYEARITSTLPRNVIGLSSITQDVLSYPLVKSKGGLRQLMAFQPEISRVFTAGGASTTFGPLKVSLPPEHALNEMVTAMVAVSEILPSEQGGSNLQVTGLYSLSKRVNVLPKRYATPPKGEAQTSQGAKGQNPMSEAQTIDTHVKEGASEASVTVPVHVEVTTKSPVPLHEEKPRLDK